MKSTSFSTGRSTPTAGTQLVPRKIGLPRHVHFVIRRHADGPRIASVIVNLPARSVDTRDLTPTAMTAQLRAVRDPDRPDSQADSAGSLRVAGSHVKPRSEKLSPIWTVRSLTPEDASEAGFNLVERLADRAWVEGDAAVPAAVTVGPVQAPVVSAGVVAQLAVRTHNLPIMGEKADARMVVLDIGTRALPHDRSTKIFGVPRDLTGGGARRSLTYCDNAAWHAVVSAGGQLRTLGGLVP